MTARKTSTSKKTAKKTAAKKTAAKKKTSAKSALSDTQRLDNLKSAADRVRAEIGKIVVGQEEVVESLLIGIFSNGHCMLEGVPGLAKTLLVQTLSDCMSLDFARVQFTPDLMPSDITGTEVMQEDKATGERDFRFIEGPIFNNVILADEINRTPPKTQAALLEGMQERQVSVAGERLPLPKPFFVLATQNPIEQEGTYPLPEAQLDRFLLKVFVDYPDREVEKQVYRMTGMPELPTLETVLDEEAILDAQELIRRIPLSELLLDYALNLVRASRPAEADAPDFIKDGVLWGAGPRGGLSMITCAKARAALHGRPEVGVEDIQAVAKPVLRHRIALNYSAEAAGDTPDTIVERLLLAVPVHKSQEDLDGRVEQVLQS